MGYNSGREKRLDKRKSGAYKKKRRAFQRRKAKRNLFCSGCGAKIDSKENYKKVKNYPFGRKSKPRILTYCMRCKYKK